VLKGVVFWQFACFFSAFFGSGFILIASSDFYEKYESTHYAKISPAVVSGKNTYKESGIRYNLNVVYFCTAAKNDAPMSQNLEVRSHFYEQVQKDDTPFGFATLRATVRFLNCRRQKIKFLSGKGKENRKAEGGGCAFIFYPRLGLFGTKVFVFLSKNRLSMSELQGICFSLHNKDKKPYPGTTEKSRCLLFTPESIAYQYN
jgi:hypothetical protein